MNRVSLRCSLRSFQRNAEATPNIEVTDFIEKAERAQRLQGIAQPEHTGSEMYNLMLDKLLAKFRRNLMSLIHQHAHVLQHLQGS